MNILLYDLTEWCKEMNMKDYRDYIGTTDWKNVCFDVLDE